MKKSIFIFIVLAIFAIGSAKAQYFDFRNNERFSIGLNVGAVGYHLGAMNHVGPHNTTESYNGFGMGANLSAGGVYVDFIYQTPDHLYTKEVGTDWNDHTALAINVGYQFPVTDFLFVMPMIGYSNETYGITEGNKFDVGDHQLIHDYEVTERFHHFNYGLGMVFRLFGEVEVGCVGTAHALYGTISYSLSKD